MDAGIMSLATHEIGKTPGYINKAQLNKAKIHVSFFKIYLFFLHLITTLVR
jgi:hypothetical protein